MYLISAHTKIKQNKAENTLLSDSVSAVKDLRQLQIPSQEARLFSMNLFSSAYLDVNGFLGVILSLLHKDQWGH